MAERGQNESWEGWWTQGHRESNSPREIGRVIDSRGLANVEIEILPVIRVSHSRSHFQNKG